MSKITLRLMGITYKPNGRSIEEIETDEPMSVRQALIKIGYPQRGLEFFIAHRGEEIIKIDAMINPGDEIFIYMPVGGG